MMQTARNLALFQELIRCGHELYFWAVKPDGSLLHTSCPMPQHFPVIHSFTEDSMQNLRLMAKAKAPVVLSGALGLIWIADSEWGVDGELSAFYAVGPIFTEDPSASRIDKTIHALDLPGEEQRALREMLMGLPVLSITRFLDFGLMLHYCLTGEHMGISEIRYSQAEKTQRRTKGKASQTDPHGTWVMEQELMRLVEEGDLDYKKKASRLVSKGRVGQLGNGDPIRNLKNMTIIFTALCMRAAIRGGLTPEIAHVLSDQYISSIESGTTFAEVAEVNAAMQEDFVQRVHSVRMKQGRSPLIENACSYLRAHYAEKLEIPALAASLGYSASRLTKLFKQETGKTVKEYLMDYRMGLAKDALRLTGEPVQDICHRLGFESPSYFGKHFKIATGMSPLEYRENQGLKGEVY